MKRTRRWVSNALLLTVFTWMGPAGAAAPDEPAILIIGASYANGATPFNDALQAPLGGISVNLGIYLSLGNAVVRDDRLSGFVINEAEAGATTFDRLACGSSSCGPAGWHGYDTQLTKAMLRVKVPDQPSYNADHVIISTPNDCLHSDAFGVPQSQALPCTQAQLDAVVDRLMAVGQTALDHGITPVFEIYPAWTALDLALAQRLFGLTWTIDLSSFTYLRNSQMTRIPVELPGSLLVDAWSNFEHIGDGLHPSPRTAAAAGKEMARVILTHRNE